MRTSCPSVGKTFGDPTDLTLQRFTRLQHAPEVDLRGIIVADFVVPVARLILVVKRYLLAP